MNENDLDNVNKQVYSINIMDINKNILLNYSNDLSILEFKGFDLYCYYSFYIYIIINLVYII